MAAYDDSSIFEHIDEGLKRVRVQLKDETRERESYEQYVDDILSKHEAAGVEYDNRIRALDARIRDLDGQTSDFAHDARERFENLSGLLRDIYNQLGDAKHRIMVLERRLGDR